MLNKILNFKISSHSFIALQGYDFMILKRILFKITFVSTKAAGSEEVV